MEPRDSRRSNRVERYDTIVIGGGQAGLAVGYHLLKNDTDFLILESAERVGEGWRRESLQFLAPAAFSSLPGMPFPASLQRPPTREDVAEYLERYVEDHELPVRTGSPVASLRWDGRRYVMDAEAIRYEATQVVVATGASSFILDHGSLWTNGGDVPGAPGLFFIGIHSLDSLTAAPMGDIGEVAASIAARILAAEGR